MADTPESTVRPRDYVTSLRIRPELLDVVRRYAADQDALRDDPALPPTPTSTALLSLVRLALRDRGYAL